MSDNDEFVCSAFKTVQINVKFPTTHEIIHKLDTEFLGKGLRSKIIKKAFKIEPKLDSQGCLKIAPSRFNPVFDGIKGRVNTTRPKRSLQTSVTSRDVNEEILENMPMSLVKKVVDLENAMDEMENFEMEKMRRKSEECLHGGVFERLFRNAEQEVAELVWKSKMKAKNDKLDRMFFKYLESERKKIQIKKPTEFVFTQDKDNRN